MVIKKNLANNIYSNNNGVVYYSNLALISTINKGVLYGY
ncbi:hypothetical protein CPS_3141 [Colwellia psychrerythraea 34H]|uniref:Uncharacterized protein n=1 Tax=Colwellia psychrerythraea (strain 34H / ATCC BAA-681) TaxID=167879 RepID=Q47ZD2_COLP3|nr:hypothetical protein CPS_3141 [Colwellia psychrerythraea 34H]